MSETSQRRRGLFITGTDTGVGKTTIGTAIVRFWRKRLPYPNAVGAYKPVASGCEFDSTGHPFWHDVNAYHQALDGEYQRYRICPQCFAAPLAPPIAARLEGRHVDPERLIRGADWWFEQVLLLVVEGAGGLLSPMSENQSNADVARVLDLDLLIVARLGLGTINHTLLTVEAAERRRLRVLGIILNASHSTLDDPSVLSNRDEIARRCTAPILGVLPYSPDSDLLHHPAFLTMMERFPMH